MQQALIKVNAIPIPSVEPEDVASGVFFLVSPEARYVTGVAIDITQTKEFL